MTKEEILKRFEFDLKAGRFKSIINSDGEAIYPFDKTEKNGEEFLFLINFIHKLNFKKATNFLISLQSADGISIKASKGEYWFYYKDPDDAIYDNEIPSYFYNYMGDVI